jgi:hypothetical protein
VASDRVSSLDLVKPEGTPAEVFARVLEATIALLDPPRANEMGVPDDDLHREILLPLLPTMLGDKVIQQHWREQTTTGFMARLGAHLVGDAERPQWMPADFEIHVAASYSAGPDAKALADTLLSEESLRDLTAALMNQLSDPAWAQLPKAEGVETVPEPKAAPLVEVAVAGPEPAIASEEKQAEEVGVAKTEPAKGDQTPSHVVPTMRPIPWNSRRNPIRGGGFLGFAFSNSLAGNPLKPWKS